MYELVQEFFHPQYLGPSASFFGALWLCFGILLLADGIGWNGNVKNPVPACTTHQDEDLTKPP